MRLRSTVSRVFSACLFTLLTFEARAAVLYQKVRTDCEYGANLSAVRDARLGEIIDAKASRVAVIGRNLIQQIMTPALELWSIRIATGDASRRASLVLQGEADAEDLMKRIRAARVVEWVGPCFSSLRIDGESVHASEDFMIDSDRWIRD